MYKLLVVDDEERVRRGLQVSVDWDELDIEIIGEAEDGKEALAIVKKEKPDIIITDIYMPEMDGLQLMKKALEIIPNTKIIILSGYEEFKIARTAIRNKAFDYLLKPVKVEDMVRVIEKAKQKIEYELSRLENEKRIKKQLQESLPVLKERYLDYLLTGRISLKKLKKKYKYLDFNLEDNNFVVMVFVLEGYICHDEDESSQIKKIKFKIMLENIINEKFKTEVLEGYPHKFISIINYNPVEEKEDIVEELHYIGKRIQNIIDENTDKTISLGIGRLYKEAKYISDSYQEALEALEYRLFRGKNQIIYIEDVDVTRAHLIRSYPFDDESEIVMALKIGDIENIEQYIKRFFEHYKEKKCFSPSQLKRACLQLIYNILRKLVEWNIDFDFNITNKESLEVVIDKMNSFEELEQFLIKRVSKIATTINERKINQNQCYIKKAIKYIDKHYKDDITIKDVAQAVYLTPNYFANLFKEETGKTIISYLTEVRIEKAKQLLKTTQLKIYEIAAAVGYQDSKYFGQVFKKQIGITPNDYRS